METQNIREAELFKDCVSFYNRFSCLHFIQGFYKVLKSLKMSEILILIFKALKSLKFWSKVLNFLEGLHFVIQVINLETNIMGL